MEEVDEVSFDYTVENDGKTHILVVDFPESVDEEAFLIALKAYMNAQNDALRKFYDSGGGYN